MAFEVLRTPQVRDAVAQQMSRTERASYEAARDELGGRGCVAGGYKLAATDGGDYPLCARHLANAWRMYTAYPDDARVVIVALDQLGGALLGAIAQGLKGVSHQGAPPLACSSLLGTRNMLSAR